MKNLTNRYLEDFIIFVKAMEDVFIHDTVDVDVIRKLAFLAEREPDVKSFIAKLGNRYSPEIDRLMKIDIKEDAENLLYNNEKKEEYEEQTKKIENNAEKAAERLNKTVNRTVEKVEGARNKVHAAHRYTRKIYRAQSDRALFSQETVDRVLNNRTPFKFN